MDDSFAVLAVFKGRWKLFHGISNVLEGLSNVRESETLFDIESNLFNVVPNKISVGDAILNWVLLVEKSEEDTFNDE